ncbi:winged helix-turn-helix transcriptional regulator [Cycloclasticus zancles]|uniref:Transcriptional regulator, HxlR family n=1 Tax=Cycloclasticus zancles 78-ME TaxID=1198232 RepID=S5TWA8_9GAMM|nr:helix-turn-helix domain-containing protein [Cycloclasticus zancles]AGS39460.1 Transcriptional regulator, HxlR family [Cycloclasticus zancles 78-ME]
MKKPSERLSKNNETGDCQVRDALLIIGGKWKNMIMHALTIQPYLRFNQLKVNIPDISQKMLTQQLRELERDGLVNRKAYAEIPPRVEYSVTKLGLTLTPVYQVINQWQLLHMSEVIKSREDFDDSKS